MSRRAALVELRRSYLAWRELDVAYEAARARVQIGLTYRALGDEDAADLELESRACDLRPTRRRALISPASSSS